MEDSNRGEQGLAMQLNKSQWPQKSQSEQIRGACAWMGFLGDQELLKSKKEVALRGDMLAMCLFIGWRIKAWMAE